MNNIKVFLGGTCNKSGWRNRIIIMLEVDYFNPVVEDWTPDCMVEEIRQREICDVVLYTITPKMTGVYSIAEVIDDSNKRPAHTVFVRLRDDGDKKFDDGQWKSLGAVAQMIERNGGKVFTDLKSAAIAINALSKSDDKHMQQGESILSCPKCASTCTHVEHWFGSGTRHKCNDCNHEWSIKLRRGRICE